MHWKSWARSAALLAAFTLTGCNIFNPNGAANASCSGGDADCYISLGQALIQDEDFDGAMDAYKQAIALDSTRSEAYWGFARSAVYKFNINTGDLIEDLTDAGGGNINAFMEHPDAVLTQRIQLAHEVVTIMDVFADRDTLSTWYKYLTKDSAKALSSDPDFAERKAFITAYLDSSTGSRAKAKFPLMDGRKTFPSLAIEFAAYKMMYKVMDFNDLNPKLLFNETDRKMQGLLNSDGSFGGLGNLADAMEDDTVLQVEVNDKILELQNGMGDVQSLLQFVGGGGGDSGTTEAQTKGKMDSAITSLGVTLVFYQFGDRLDNDGDGCLDEEIVDSLDNDLDGFVDEDARLIKGTGSLGDPGDQLNNNRAGLTDDALENRAGVLLSPTRPYVMTFVANYLLSAGEVNKSEDQTTWVKIKKGASNIDARIAIQTDSLAVHLTPGLPVPAQYQAKLQAAKDLIGGCWRSY